MRQAKIEINFPVKKGDLRRPPAPLYTTMEFDSVAHLKSKISEAISSYHWENMTVKVSNLDAFNDSELEYLKLNQLIN